MPLAETLLPKCTRVQVDKVFYRGQTGTIKSVGPKQYGVALVGDALDSNLHVPSEAEATVELLDATRATVGPGAHTLRSALHTR